MTDSATGSSDRISCSFQIQVRGRNWKRVSRTSAREIARLIASRSKEIAFLARQRSRTRRDAGVLLKRTVLREIRPIPSKMQGFCGIRPIRSTWAATSQSAAHMIGKVRADRIRPPGITKIHPFGSFLKRSSAEAIASATDEPVS